LKNIFQEEEVLDIEEAQDKNIFGDIQDLLEDNYLDIEDKITFAKENYKEIMNEKNE